MSTEPGRTLVVIPARGGSKGIPRKNLAEIVPGLSLLELTIDQALRCHPREDVVVSTEDDEIATVASARGAHVILRPAELAQDESTTASVVDHLLALVDPERAVYGAITILQVTSPLRRDQNVLRAHEMMASGDYDSVVGACPLTGIHPAKMYVVENASARAIAPQFETRRRQDLPPVFRRNGAIFSVTRKFYADTGTLWGGRVGLVEMPVDISIDVDAPEQLEAVRAVLGAV